MVFTDYPFNGKAGRIYEVELLSFDGNKYATVRLKDGSVRDVKLGYLHHDFELNHRMTYADVKIPS